MTGLTPARYSEIKNAAREVVSVMPASQDFYDAMTARLKNTPDRETVDLLLDFWNQCTYGATEYDSELWGFPDNWMANERAQMEDRIKSVALVKAQGEI